MNKNNGLSERQLLEKRYNGARGNLMLVVVFTVINIVLMLINSNTYFLFSAYIPYMLVSFGMMLCGMFPEEYYGEDLASLEFFNTSFLWIMAGIAAVIVVLYLVCWIFSKNKKAGWLIFALVFFVIDTLGMFVMTGFVVDNIIDIAFHVWVVVSLFLGVISCFKLKKLPADEVVASEPDAVSELTNMVESPEPAQIHENG